MSANSKHFSQTESNNTRLNMKNYIFLKPFLLLTIFLSFFLSTPNQANANMFNKFKKGFYFEKYKNAQEAKAELLKLHPIGSDVGELVKRLEGAGAMVKLQRANNEEVIYFYEYNNGIAIINPLKWSGGIRFDSKKNIIDFGVGKQYMGL
jgi:hypothetical protein